MRLLRTGAYEKPFEVKWNECLFVDIWGWYNLYTDCSGTTFKFRLEKFLEARNMLGSNFSQNYIRIIESGKK